MIGFLVFLLFFLLPSGWAKHWIVDQSLVNGVLVDYLMPDLWLQDILAFAFIILNRERLKRLIKDKVVLVSLGLIIIPIFFSSVPLVSLVYFSRFLLAVTVGYLLIKIFKGKDGKKVRRIALIGLLGALVWTGALAFFQMINQGTVFGWWFLGEPIFNSGSGGVKKIEIFNKIVVAPMATFPHSNVLAGFSLLGLAIILREKKTKWRFWAVLFSFVSILGSLSFYTILLKPFSFLKSPSLWRRWELIKISLRMIKDNFLFGVGWGSFVKKMPEYWQEMKTNFRFLQPVHNIFLIVPSEIGFIGLLGIVGIVGRLFKRVLRKENILFLSICFLISLIDHYFWTTTQGIYTAFFFLSFQISC